MTKPSKPRVCAHCGTTDDVDIDFLCDPCLLAKCTASRAAQGLPTPSESEAAYRRLGQILHTPDGSTGSSAA